MKSPKARRFWPSTKFDVPIDFWFRLCYALNMSKTITVISKPNGERAFRGPIEGLSNVDLVTLQKDGELRWASVGPLTLEDTLVFHDALRLALSFACKTSNSADSKDRLAFNIAGGVTYNEQVR